MATNDVQPVSSEFTILIDRRERKPFAFDGLRADADRERRPLAVPTRIGHLRTGDYTIDTLASHIAIERKSLTDLYGTLGQARPRFQRELSRLSLLPFAAVVIEADWPEILNSPPPRSNLNPKTIYRSIIAWQQRFPTVHWWPCPSRPFAEVTTYRILERFWKEFTKTQKAVARRMQHGQ